MGALCVLRQLRLEEDVALGSVKGVVLYAIRNSHACKEQHFWTRLGEALRELPAQLEGTSLLVGLAARFLVPRRDTTGICFVAGLIVNDPGKFKMLKGISRRHEVDW